MSNHQKFNLTGKTALVTGCKRGIGRAMAVDLAEAGAEIISVSATLETSGIDVEQVTELRRTFKGYQCDFADRAAVYTFIEHVKSDTPRVDIFVNNAGMILHKPAAEHPDEYWDKVIEVNLNAQFVLSREFGKEMIDRGSGKVVFTASLLTFQGGIAVPGYAASKGGIGQLTMAFANEWAGSGVNVNAIARGYIATDNRKALRDDPVRSERFSRASRRVDGANRMTSKDLSCSSHRMPPNTSTAQRCSSMEAGWAGNAFDDNDSIAT